jgi:dTDP-4-dehydrorhamnose 3,5-epimerase-like enzyme
MIEYIHNNNEIISIIIRSHFNTDGIKFFTPDDFSQQLAYMNRERGYTIPPHVHNQVDRKVSLTQEVLFIKSGKVRVDYYNDEKKYLESRILNLGDVVLFSGGGHGFTMIENSEIIEVKQGPYSGDQDKTRFEPINDEKINIK